MVKAPPLSQRELNQRAFNLLNTQVIPKKKAEKPLVKFFKNLIKKIVATSSTSKAIEKVLQQSNQNPE